MPKNLEARRSFDNTAFWDHRKRVQDVIERMELDSTIAARIGVEKGTIWDWLAGRNQPKAATSFQGVCPRCGASGPKAGQPSGSAQGVEWEVLSPTIITCQLITEAFNL
jgi:hypothetical protein